MHQQQRDLYGALLPLLSARRPDLFPPGRCTLDTFLWCLAIVQVCCCALVGIPIPCFLYTLVWAVAQTRGFNVKQVRSARSGQLEEEEEAAEEGQGGGSGGAGGLCGVHVACFADLMNHSSASACVDFFRDQHTRALVYRFGRAVRAGEEVCLNYGRYSSSQMLLNYGFVDDSEVGVQGDEKAVELRLDMYLSVDILSGGGIQGLLKHTVCELVGGLGLLPSGGGGGGGGGDCTRGASPGLSSLSLRGASHLITATVTSSPSAAPSGGSGAAAARGGDSRGGARGSTDRARARWYTCALPAGLLASMRLSHAELEPAAVEGVAGLLRGMDRRDGPFYRYCGRCGGCGRCACHLSSTHSSRCGGGEEGGGGGRGGNPDLAADLKKSPCSGAFFAARDAVAAGCGEGEGEGGGGGGSLLMPGRIVSLRNEIDVTQSLCQYLLSRSQGGAAPGGGGWRGDMARRLREEEQCVIDASVRLLRGRMQLLVNALLGSSSGAPDSS
jgi:hypothetical protein